MGIIVFYEGNNGTQNIVQTVEDTPGQNFRPVNHDPIRSLKLYGVRAGADITVFKSANGSTDEDFCVIRVKRTGPEYTVDTFERSYEDEYVIVSYIRSGNGDFDGSVGRIKIN